MAIRRLPFHYVYKLWEGETLAYVGESATPGSRIDSHLEKWWGVSISRIELIPHKDRYEAKADEARLIKELSPTYNVKGSEKSIKSIRVNASQKISVSDEAAAQSELLKRHMKGIPKRCSASDIYKLMHGGRSPNTSETIGLTRALKFFGWKLQKISGRSFWVRPPILG